MQKGLGDKVVGAWTSLRPQFYCSSALGHMVQHHVAGKGNTIPEAVGIEMSFKDLMTRLLKKRLDRYNTRTTLPTRVIRARTRSPNADESFPKQGAGYQDPRCGNSDISLEASRPRDSRTIFKAAQDSQKRQLPGFLVPWANGGTCKLSSFPSIPSLYQCPHPRF